MEENNIKKQIVDNHTFFTHVLDIIASKDSVIITVKGTSMQPTLMSEKDKVRLIPHSSGDLHIGAIALFKYSGTHILHRLVKKKGDILIFQGDNISHFQEKVTAKDVFAIVDQIIKEDGENIECLAPGYLKRDAMIVKKIQRTHRYRKLIKPLVKIKKFILK